MITFKPKKADDDGFPKKVSIREATDQSDILLRLARAFGSKLLGPQTQPGMNGFSDYLDDWYDENWGKKAAVQINGFAELLKADPEFALFLVTEFGKAEVAIVASKVREKPETSPHLHLGNLRIILA
jgi:hypothetical protein